MAELILAHVLDNLTHLPRSAEEQETPERLHGEHVSHSGRTRWVRGYDGQCWPAIRVCVPDITVAPFGREVFARWFPWLFEAS